MAVNQALLDAIEKKELIASLNGAATPTEPKPQGRSAAAAAEQFMLKEPQATNEWYDAPRSALRGATMGASDAIGAGLAAIPASYGSGRGLGETYDDIRGTLQYEEDAANERDSGLNIIENVGTGAGLLATGLPQAAGRLALAGASKVGGKLAMRSSTKQAAARAAKPRMAQVNGEWVRVAPGAGKMTRVQGMKEGAGSGLGVDTAQSIFSNNDTLGDTTAAGAAAGLAFPRLARALNLMKKGAGAAVGSPLARLGTSRAAGKVFGNKIKPLAYTASHPATRNQAARGLSAYRKAKDARKAAKAAKKAARDTAKSNARRGQHIKTTKQKARRKMEEELDNV